MTPPRVAQPAIPFLRGVSELSQRYDGFLLDLWGVVHDGIRPYPGAVACMTALKARAKRVVLLSNAPRRAAAIEAAMTAMGVPSTAYDHVLSSGELAWQALRERRDPWHGALGRRCLHLGPERDKGLLEGLALDEVGDAEGADFVLNTGIDRDEETVADYEATLARAASCRLPMLCANPDLEVMRGGRRVICAGALARHYEGLGGAVAYHGKPYPAAYRSALDLLGIDDRARIVAIGDSVRTDVAGAAQAGLDAVLVTGGIHSHELGLPPGRENDPALVLAACRCAGHVPSALLRAFVW
ncbi:MAG: TIGR01459 family HAD-type hydrolase [Alphaproteobacteria bacterium]